MTRPRRIRTKKVTPGWYKVEKGGVVYYTNEPRLTRSRVVVGNGIEKGTPKQVKDLLDDFAPDDLVQSNDGVYTVEIEKTENFVELPPGTYVFKYNDYPLPDRLVPIDFRSDKYVDMPKITEKILLDFNTFIENEAIYRKLNICYKAGMLVYGPAGTGKTAAIRNVVRDKLPKDAITICIQNALPPIEFLSTMKETLGDRLKIWILEEFTHFCEDPFKMEAILTFLDGENSIDKSFIFATTNYPEILPHNIVSRPSRIAYLHEVGFPEPEERKALLSYYLDREATDEEIRLTNKNTADGIKEICLLTHMKKLSFADAKKAVDEHMDKAKRAFKGKENRIGF